jgi:flagellar hook assembly protein FlgD
MVMTSTLPPDASVGSRPVVVTRFSVSVFPNPASVAAAIHFRLPSAARGRVEILDMTGRRIALVTDAVFPEGPTTVTWNGRLDDGRRASPGIYSARVHTSRGSRTARLAWLPDR